MLGVEDVLSAVFGAEIDADVGAMLADLRRTREGANFQAGNAVSNGPPHAAGNVTVARTPRPSSPGTISKVPLI